MKIHPILLEVCNST